MLTQPSQGLDAHTRHLAFPVTKHRIFLGHAGVSPLPRVAAEKMQQAAQHASQDQQESAAMFQEVHETRAVAAQLIKAKAEEIALLGPTALGLNLVANGLPWQAGDEVVFYPDDYPANVYPWQNLATRGVKPVALQPETTGHLTPELVLRAVTPHTRLVALASCHFLTGCRLDYQTIGAELKKRGVLFCLDGIQSLGATELDADYFDFLSADSHKWLLGPLGAGFFYVKEKHFDQLQPTLLGAWNVQSPGYIAQPKIAFEPTARRYECGSLFVLGILGMRASMEMLQQVGLERIQERLIHLHHFAAVKFRQAGFHLLSDDFPEAAKSGIITVTKYGADLTALHQKLTQHQVAASLRWNRAGEAFLRFSPHFYNTEDEISETVKILLS